MVAEGGARPDDSLSEVRVSYRVVLYTYRGLWGVAIRKQQQRHSRAQERRVASAPRTLLKVRDANYPRSHMSQQQWFSVMPVSRTHSGRRPAIRRSPIGDEVSRHMTRKAATISQCARLRGNSHLTVHRQPTPHRHRIISYHTHGLSLVTMRAWLCYRCRTVGSGWPAQRSKLATSLMPASPPSTGSHAATDQAVIDGADVVLGG